MKWEDGRERGNRRGTIKKSHGPTFVSTAWLDIRNDWRTNDVRLRRNTHPYTHVRMTFSRFVHTYIRMHIYIYPHAFIYGRLRRADGPDATSRREIAHNAAIATRGDSIYIRNFCSLTANIRARPRIPYAWWNLSWSRAPAVAVCIRESTSVRLSDRFSNPLHLLHLQILNFLQINPNREIHRNAYVCASFATRIQKYNINFNFSAKWKDDSIA